ncbi:MAG TPA: hypothetical protein IAB06_03580, partial [Candidatus Avacidaminococcus intestinavium]|nr:hypothetical protein [Candidatus Avacidaminococcus intestinavium]
MIAELLSDRIIGSIFFLLGSLCLIRYLYKEHNNMDIPTKIVTVLGLIGAICLADKNISGFFYPILKLKIKNFDLLFASVLG